MSNLNTDEHTIDVPTASKGISSPSLHSKAHRHTLEFITEAAQELYAKGQLLLNNTLDTLRRSIKICKLLKVNCNLLSPEDYAHS